MLRDEATEHMHKVMDQRLALIEMLADLVICEPDLKVAMQHLALLGERYGESNLCWMLTEDQSTGAASV